MFFFPFFPDGTIPHVRKGMQIVGKDGDKIKTDGESKKLRWHRGVCSACAVVGRI